MKIALVSHDYRRLEGHGRYTVEIATRISRDHEVHVFANQIEKEAGSEGIHFHHVPAATFNVLAKVVTFAASARSLPNQEFDVIHAQGFCTWGCELLTAHIANQAWHRALHRAQGLSVKEKIFGVVSSRLERQVYQSAKLKRVIAISERVARDLRTDYECRAPIDVIYHGVDLERFSPRLRPAHRNAVRQRLGLAERDFVVLLVGDLRKGARQAMEAAVGIAGAKLVLVSRSAAEEYKVHAARLGMAERVVFTGPTKDVGPYYGCADAFLLPTPYDAFGMVVTEAMASGLPVVVSRQAGASELVEEGVNGLLTQDPTDITGMSQALAMLEGDRAAALRMGEAARQTAEKLSWNSVAKRTEETYEKIRRAL